MNTDALISILMPVYNAAPFLKACIQSILEQSESNWELIAVDDQSTDESAAILAAFAGQDQRIRCFKTKEKGIIPALRMAFEQSNGQLISRMDADDLMEKDKLLHLKTTVLEHGLGHISTGWVRYFSDEGLMEGYRKYADWLNQLCRQQNHYTAIYRECVLPSPCWMAWRTDLIGCGAFDPKVYPEDYDLCFRFYKSRLTIVPVNEVLHLWRDHSQRSSRNDPNYANPQYFDLKLPYFLELDYNSTRPLLLWGAGKKGKLLAKKLQIAKVDFHWITNNPQKQGKSIYDQLLLADTQLHQWVQPQIIVAVAAPDDQKEIQTIVDKKGWQAGLDYFFFC